MIILKFVFKSKNLLIFNFCIVVIIPVIIISLIILQIIMYNIQQEISEKNMIITRSIAKQAESEMNEASNSLEQIKTGIETQTITNNSQIMTYLYHLTYDYNFFNNIQVIRFENDAITDLSLFNDYRFSEPVLKEYYNHSLKAKSSFWLLEKIHDSQNSHILIVVPIKNGIIIGHYKLDLLKNILEHNYPSSIISKVLVTTDGDFITATNMPSSAAELSNIKTSISNNIDNDTFTFTQKSNSMVGNIVMLQQSKWKVVTYQSTKDASSLLNKIKVILLSGSVFILLVGLIIEIWILDRVLKPLSLFTKNTKEIANGNYNISLNSTQYREINDLAESFMTMSHKIKTREEDLRKSREDFRTLVSNVPGVVYRCEYDTEQRMIFMTDVIHQISGYTAIDFIVLKTKEFSQIIHPEDLQRVHMAIKYAIKERQPYELEYRIIRTDGSIKWVTDKGQSVFDEEEGKFLWLDGVIFDITVRKIFEDRINRINEELEQKVIERTEQLSSANSELIETLKNLQDTQVQLILSEKMAALGNMVAGIAHEINTPVGIGVTAASHLQKKTIEFSNIYNENQVKKSDFEEFMQTSKDTSNMILTNLQHASALIQSFKRVAVDQTSEERRIFNIKEYLEEILLSMRPVLKKTKHAINISCPDNIEVNSYPGALTQIINNLVMNSLRHAFDEEDQGSIFINITKENNNIKLVYSDDGKGIDKTIIDKIYDPFFTTKRGKGGSGLGLNIVYNLVTQKLNGEINCNSILTKGTTFTIIFPLEVE